MNDGNGWKQIPGYEGFYSASMDGQIRRDPGSFGCPTGRILKPKLHHSATEDYHRIDLSREGEIKSHFIHRLIMLTFEGPCPDGNVVCHGQEGSLCNRRDNLKYDTQSENVKYGIWMQAQQKKADSGSEDDSMV